MIGQVQCVEMHQSLQKRAMKNKTRKAFNDLSQWYGNKETAKEDIKLYKETLAV